MQTTYIPICRHIKTNGRVCQAAALRDRAYCYHHQKLHGTRSRTLGVGPGLSTNVLHSLRNARSIQQTLSMVFSGLATGQIHPKNAGQMLRALQMVVSLNQNP